MRDDQTVFPVLETERLILRQVGATDAPDLLHYLSKQAVVEHMGLEPFTTNEDALDEINWYKSIYENKTGVRWGITLKGEDHVIGSCGYLKYAAQHQRAEIGFELSPDHWGKGIASEALDAVVTYGFQHLPLYRIEALIEPLNEPSQKLVEKHGFLKEGLLRGYEYTRGKHDDLYMYSLLKTDRA